VQPAGQHRRAAHARDDVERVVAHTLEADDASLSVHVGRHLQLARTFAALDALEDDVVHAHVRAPLLHARPRGEDLAIGAKQAETCQGRVLRRERAVVLAKELRGERHGDDAAEMAVRRGAPQRCIHQLEAGLASAQHVAHAEWSAGRPLGEEVGPVAHRDDMVGRIAVAARQWPAIGIPDVQVDHRRQPRDHVCQTLVDRLLAAADVVVIALRRQVYPPRDVAGDVERALGLAAHQDAGALRPSLGLSACPLVAPPRRGDERRQRNQHGPPQDGTQPGGQRCVETGIVFRRHVAGGVGRIRPHAQGAHQADEDRGDRERPQLHRFVDPPDVGG
jgi:hypothetical protein